MCGKANVDSTLSLIHRLKKADSLAQSEVTPIHLKIATVSVHEYVNYVNCSLICLNLEHTNSEPHLSVDTGQTCKHTF